MPLKKSNCPIIRKRKHMLNLLRLTMVLELIHDFRPEACALVLFVDCQKGNLVKGFVLKASKSNSRDYLLTHFGNEAFMDRVKKQLNYILTRHFGELPGVKVFEIGQILENVYVTCFDCVFKERKLQWLHMGYLSKISFKS
jgi:hypothetical protein